MKTSDHIGIAATLAVLVSECQTRITAEKHAEMAHPIQTVVDVNGTNQVVTSGYSLPRRGRASSGCA